MTSGAKHHEIDLQLTAEPTARERHGLGARAVCIECCGCPRADDPRCRKCQRQARAGALRALGRAMTKKARKAGTLSVLLRASPESREKLWTPPDPALTNQGFAADPEYVMERLADPTPAFVIEVSTDPSNPDAPRKRILGPTYAQRYAERLGGPVESDEPEGSDEPEEPNELDEPNEEEEVP